MYDIIALRERQHGERVELAESCVGSIIRDVGICLHDAIFDICSNLFT